MPPIMDSPSTMGGGAKTPAAPLHDAGRFSHRCPCYFLDGHGHPAPTSFPIYPQEYIRIRPDFVPQRYGERNGVLGDARLSGIDRGGGSGGWDYLRRCRGWERPLARLFRAPCWPK